MRANRVFLLVITLACVPGAIRAQSPGDTRPAGKSGRAKPTDYRKAAEGIKVDLPPYYGPKRRLAVADMEVKITANVASDPTPSGGTVTTTTVSVPPPADFGTGLTEMLTTALLGTKRFVVLERSDKALQDIQKEQNLQGTHPETRVEPNRMMAAQMIIRGAVTEFTYRRTTSGGAAQVLQGLGVASGKVEAAVALDLRMYDAATGEVIGSEQAEGRARSSSTVLTLDTAPLKFGGSSSSTSPLAHATREAIQKAVLFICREMEARPWEARIAEVVTDEGQGIELYVTAGSKDGIQAGDELDVFRPGKVVMDPDNPARVVLQTRGVRIGRCKVVDLQPKFCICRPVSGEGFAARDVVRMSGASPGTGGAPVPAEPAP